MRRACFAALPLLLLAAASLAQSPPSTVTLKLENASLHQALLRLREQTQLGFESRDGAGSKEYQVPQGTPRRSIEWKDAPLYRVLRDVSRLYGGCFERATPNAFRFLPGMENQPQEQVRDGLGFSILKRTHSDMTFSSAGADSPARRRGMVRMDLVVRAENGRPEELGAVTRITATDAQGKALPVSCPAVPSETALPDERVYMPLITLPVGAPHRLQRLEGEVGILNPEESRKIQVPLPQPNATVALPQDQSFGRIRVRLLRLRVVKDGVEFSLRYSTPADVTTDYLRDPATSLLIREASGRSGPATYHQRYGLEKDGSDYIQVDGFRRSDSQPVALEMTVATCDGYARRVPFRFDNVVLPSATQEPVVVRNAGPPAQVAGLEAGPKAFFDANGGTIRLPPLGLNGRRGVRVSIGFERQEADGSWSTARWVEREAFWDPVRVRSLRPGTYRVSVRRGAADRKSAVMQSLGSAVIQFRPGGETLVPLK